MTLSAADTIRNQVMWNRLNSIVEEQAQALMRASFSPAVREGGDLAAGIFDLRGRMMAQAVTGTPGHVNTMAAAVPHFLRAIPPATMRPGDAIITNDPWIASGHLHDVTIVTPAYYHGALVGYFAALVFHYTLAYTVYGIKCMVAPSVPNNHGSMQPFAIVAPEGCILNCVRPAPVAARHIVGHALPDVVLGCLHRALPEGGAPAESSMMWNPYLRGERWFDGSHRAWEAFYFNSGGMGGRAGIDGLSATAFPSGIRGIPVEAAEAVAPIMVWRKELRPDSAGAGQFRGGFGQVVEIGSAIDGAFEFQAMFDRVDNAARGQEGGGDGMPGSVRLRSGAVLRAKGLQTVPAACWIPW